MKPKDLDKFSEFPIPTYEEWRQAAERSLKGAPFEKKLLTHLYEGITTEPMYQEKDVESLATLSEQPGQFPFTRGTEHKRDKWRVSQELSGATPEVLNEHALNDLARGQNVLHLVLDEAAKGNPKKDDDRGVKVESAADFQLIFEGIDVEKYPMHLYTGALLSPVLSTVAASIDEGKLCGIIACDPLSELAKQGELSFSLSASYDDMAEASKWVIDKQKDIRTVLVQSDAYHNGGASAADELACALSTGVEYVSELMNRGLSADQAGSAMAFSFSIGSQSFVEIAKIRSARLLWAAIMKAFGASEEGSKMFIHARTSAFTKAKLDPYVNMLRGTSEAFSAAVAGADSIQVSPFDEPIQPSTSFSRRIARNTSLILMEESHLAATQDASGGAWYVEHLTDEIAKKAWQKFQEIEACGGMSQALAEGLPQAWINETWEARLEDVETRKQTVVGVNQYANLDEALLHENKEAAEWAIDRTRTAEKSLEVQPASFDEWLHAAKEGYSLSAMYKVIVEDSNEQARISEPVESRRLSMPYEQMRDLSKQFEQKKGERASAVLIGIGPLAKYKPRADFAAGYFRAGGFEVESPFNADSIKNSASDLAKEHVFVICGTDEDLKEHAPALISELKQMISHDVRIYITGKQKDEAAALLNEAGATEYIHMRANHYEQLMNLWNWRARQ
ncbi:methylmalonyl-CoA mutase family protein [Alkalihalophilus pseudofirmus]|uniref:Methylmalonyl-CoA mutase family protein n=1 Tax=Alkalihalophilus pseudofirmus TaxID=79885 RepID=A0AAJ2U247_ALKPS|nr:methylmalonyl-CoA mutase family protein [Alkalihalophilus pseudofirmus]MDV2885735.1 methylmalonyl-CoA mutase family protein [Alkalihalophilus pseudofirmus]WEG16037.1 methylmalonyl-CoA mutase family protein [Alkalihalophilus pseudofirmus]